MKQKKKSKSSTKQQHHHDLPARSSFFSAKTMKKKDSNDSTETKKKSNVSMFVTTIVVPILVMIAAIALKSTNFENNVSSSSTTRSSTERKIENFLNWLRQNGANISPSVNVASFPEFGGYGLQAKIKNIDDDDDDDNEATRSKISKPNQDLITNDDDDDDDEEEKDRKEDKNEYAIKYLQDMFTIPDSIIISPMSIIREFSSNSSSGTTQKIPRFQQKVSQLVTEYITSSSMAQQDVVIALYLMTQCTLGERSNFKPYLDILPSYLIPRLDTFNEEELDMLQDDDLAFVARESYQQLESIWNSRDLQSLLSSMIDSTSSSTRSDDSQSENKNFDTSTTATTASLKQQCISFHSFHKYVAIVSSRAMVLEGIKYLTPLPEFANYQPRKDERKALKGKMNQSFLLYHERNDRTGSITVRADRNVKYGEQIFEDYGDIDNSLYLEAHGFVPDENPFHCAVIPPNLISSPQNLPKGLVDALIALRVLPDATSNQIHHPPPTICILDDGSISDSKAEAYLTIMSLSMFGEDQNSDLLMTKCTDAVHSNDDEFIQLQCLKYKGHEEMLARVITKLTADAICQSKSRLSDDLKVLDSMLAPLNTANDSIKKILALKFRIADKRILEDVSGMKGIDCSNRSSFLAKEFIVDECPIPDIPKPKTSKVDKSNQLENFKKFLDSLGLPISKVKPTFVGDGMRLGVVATQDIEKGEIYLSIKGSSVINKDTMILNTQNDQKLREFLGKYKSKAGDDEFEKLLLFLLHAKFVSKQQSIWHPYVDILPSVDEMKEYSPLFIDAKLYDYAAGSELRVALIRNQRKAEEMFSSMLLNKDVMRFFSENVMHRDHFFWAYSIIDSRSIWFDGKRNLVPLLDLVNCKEIRDEEEAGSVNAVHKTYLDNARNAVTKATLAYKEGDQIFENYAQPNHIYFSYHGFSLGDNNTHDCALWSGLGITSKDEGAKDMADTRSKLAKYGFTSLNPSFCIKDMSSLDNVATFLRIKHGLLSSDNESLGLSSDIIPLMKTYLNDRIHRFEATKKSTSCKDKMNLPTSVQTMFQIVDNEQKYFEELFEELSTM